MKTIPMKPSELGVIALTRGLAGLGLGLLLAQKIQPNRRRATGWALLLAGAGSTIPILIHLWKKSGNSASPHQAHATP